MAFNSRLALHTFISDKKDVILHNIVRRSKFSFYEFVSIDVDKLPSNISAHSIVIVSNSFQAKLTLREYMSGTPRNRFWKIYSILCCLINPSPPSTAYMRWWTSWAFLQVMACCLFGAKSLPEPILGYCQLDSWKQMSVKFESEFYHFHSRNCIWKCSRPILWPFFVSRDRRVKGDHLATSFT